MPKTTARMPLEYPFCPLNLAIEIRFLIELMPRYIIGMHIPSTLYLVTPNTFSEIKPATFQPLFGA